MLFRKHNDAVIAISQPAHAWVSGQLARAWGNDRFGRLVPREAIVLAAEQHDVGWMEWETSPALNPETHLPHSFMELPFDEHLAIWRRAGQRVETMNPYAALLVSRHGTGLYRMRDLSREAANDADKIHRFLEDQGAYQQALIDRLRQSDDYALHVNPAALARASRLIGVWDWLSLWLCMGRSTTETIRDVPMADGEVAMSLKTHDDDCSCVDIRPWPFGAQAVEVEVTGRRIRAFCSSTADMHEMLRNAPLHHLVFRLTPRA